MSGDEILYVGDHMFGDVHVTKNVLRWRTALILRELEDEIRAISAFRATEARLAERMQQKERLEAEACQVRLELQRAAPGLRARASPRPRTSSCTPAPPSCALRTRGARRGARPHGARRQRAGQPHLGPAHARGQRQEPPGAPGGALRGHLHVARVQLPLRHALRLSAQPARQPARTTRARPAARPSSPAPPGTPPRPEACSSSAPAPAPRARAAPRTPGPWSSGSAPPAWPGRGPRPAAA